MKSGGAKAVVPNLHHMAERTSADFLRQKLQKGLEVAGVEFHRGQELPIDRAEFVLQLHDAAREESRDGVARIGQYLAISGKARRLEREDETVRRLVTPFGVGLRLLRPIEGAVDLDRRKMAAGVFEFAFLRECVRVECSPPGFVGPPAGADPDRACSCFAHLLTLDPDSTAKYFKHPVGATGSSYRERFADCIGRSAGYAAIRRLHDPTRCRPRHLGTLVTRHCGDSIDASGYSRCLCFCRAASQARAPQCRRRPIDLI